MSFNPNYNEFRTWNEKLRYGTLLSRLNMDRLETLKKPEPPANFPDWFMDEEEEEFDFE